MEHFINQALIFIAATVFVVPLFHRLGFGAVLGYLIAGIIVGPFGLGFIKDSESAMHFSELGVVLLLFLIGLEIQPRKLWMMRKKLLQLGVGQVFLTTLVLTLILHLLGLSYTSSAVIGFGLSLSSTAFAIQSMKDQNQFNTEFGQSAFSILLTQDLLAIPALAIIPALSSDVKSDTSPVQTILLIPIIFIALAFASRFLVKPLFRLIASTRTREIFTAAALFIVLGVSSLMIKIGLSAALGAFLAGVLLADSEYRHELEADVEPFKSLLMGLFFISVGMGVSLELILAKPFLVFSLAIGYLAVKFIVIYVLGLWGKLGHEGSKMMALNISQGGEFAFVIFGIVVDSHLGDQSLIKLLTAVITITMAMSPLLNVANEKWAVWKSKNGKKPDFDKIENEDPQVIIAGFGRFGQTFARILRLQKIPFVAIDQDPDQIEFIRKFGHKVYYGDASRVDLLHAAGASKAKFFVLAIDDVEMSLQTARVVKDNFPNLTIFARARNRGHAFDLMDMNITHIKREVAESSVSFVKELLIELGKEETIASMIVEKFKEHDELMLLEQYKVRNDDENFISVSKQATAQLAQVFEDESQKSYIKPRP